ncbi:uncharacterized protein F5891DRAFT_974086 [Suillus fuscotomentosus]|uniref:DUF6532 domain-containing protein n=1 Tax=Suillus fuscotomentosus TaxID=1912939 RepID=A0AAD4EM80_9AGAM|nr:uncharacterized protein F5891DRAFT_974086 [Suillus fuscotomentosus]KAG1908767.1 hypothetical protein F5891DRAFT_974086 [Suillus fuscotomentosus]
MERLTSATTMIEEHLQPYSILSLCTDSHCASRVSASVYLDDEHPERTRQGSKLELKPMDMKFYSKADQKNTEHTHKLIILDMLLESGWQKTSKLEQVAAECILQASAVSGHITEHVEGINKLIFDGLLSIRGKLVNEAEQVLSNLNIYPPDDSRMTNDEKKEHIRQHAADLLDNKNILEYALHSYDSDRGKTLVYSAPAFLDLHEDFWFGQNSPFLDPQSRALISCISWHMYTLMGAAIMCVVHRALEGQFLGSGRKIFQFTMENFSGAAGGIRQAMMQYVANPKLDEYEFMPYMQAHHTMINTYENYELTWEKCPQ